MSHLLRLVVAPGALVDYDDFSGSAGESGMNYGTSARPSRALSAAMKATRAPQRSRALAGLSLTLLAGASGCGPEQGAAAENAEESSVRHVAQALAPDVRHVLVYHEPGIFAAWPANHGVWSWGNEILVGFERATYEPNPSGFHHTTGDGTFYLARSADGGEHWMIEKREELDELLGPNEHPSETDKPPLNWAEPHFAMKLYHNGYWLSQARGHFWKGPYEVPDFGHDDLSGRTALVHTQGKTLFFMSVASGSAFEYAHSGCVDGEVVEPRIEDVARTMVFSKEDDTDGFQDENWAASRPGAECPEPLPEPPGPCDSGYQPPACPSRFNYSIMASPVVVEDEWEDEAGLGADTNADPAIVVALRERGDTSRIRVRVSRNGGSSWGTVFSNVGGNPNNPGSLVKLNDGRLALVYGHRDNAGDGGKSRMWARVSNDWSTPIALTGEALNSDMGYVQAVTRPDGRVVVIYYFTTQERPEQHIRATIWTPEGVDVKPVGNLSESLILSAL